MYMESPSQICGRVASTGRKRSTKSAPIASSRATSTSQPKERPPRAGNPKTGDGQNSCASQTTRAIVGSPIMGHNCGPAWSSGHVTLKPYEPTPEVTETVAEIVQLHRLRQDMIRAQTKLSLQAQASLRLMFLRDEDFADDAAKEKARKRNDDLFRRVSKDPAHELYGYIAPYLLAAHPLEEQRAIYEKMLVKAAKRLPVYSWVKGVNGFGDISFATIVGECGDIGTYKSVSAVWKRLGLAVINGQRQGNPGDNASKEDWILHGYNKQRRSVSWNARNGVIGGMGLWRPLFNEDVNANPDLTYYQRVYAERARYEAAKLNMPVTLKEATGKESYTKHVANRAHRYVEKRLLKHLYIEWRRAA